MKRLHFFLLLAGILLTACGGDDDVTSGGDTPKPVTPSTPTSWSLEITSPVTRGLSGDASGITPTWETTDNIYVYYGNQRVGVLHPKEHKDNASSYVQLEGNLDTPVSGAYSTSGKLSFYYQCDKGFNDYTGQDGTLATIASSFDYHVAENVPITAVDAVNRKVTVGQFNLKPQQAIARFSFTRPLVANDVITISEGGNTISSITLGANANVAENTGYIDVALPLTANAEKHTLTFDIKRGNDANFYKTIMADKTIQNGKTYKAALVLAVQLNGVWWATRNLADPLYGGKKFPDNEYDGGHYFAWGEKNTRNTRYDTPYDKPNDLNYSVGGNLSSGHDAAYQIWGRAWRMPTGNEMQKLSAAFPEQWSMKNELMNYPGTTAYGMKFSDPNNSDKYIFLPAAGYWTSASGGANVEGHYWTSSIWTYLDEAPYDYSTRFYFNAAHTEKVTNIWDGARNCGCPIRPVLNIQ